jgi:uncharacterized protein (DUF433 family)
MARTATDRKPKTRQRSFRFSERTLQDLERSARESNTSANGMAARLIEEGLRTARHPLIHFRNGGAGRRPAIVGTRLDVWQVIAYLRANDNDVATVAELLQRPEAHIRACVSYYAEFKDEIDTWIEDEREFSRRAEEAWEREQKALA